MTNKLNKPIKILSLIFLILLSLLPIALIAFSFINIDIVSDEFKHMIYNAVKYVLIGACASSICVPILLSIKHLKQHKPNIYWNFNTIKIVLMFAIGLTQILMLLIAQTQYGVRTELWYAHRTFFISLVVLLDSLCINSFVIHTNKYLSNFKNKVTPEQALIKSFMKTSFIGESAWMVFSSLLGVIMMFLQPRTAQYCSSITWIMVLYIVFNLIFMCIAQHKKPNFYIWLIITIIGAILSIFLISSHYLMFPARIIDAIKINYFVCGWSFGLVIAFVPAIILASQKAI